MVEKWLKTPCTGRILAQSIIYLSFKDEVPNKNQRLIRARKKQRLNLPKTDEITCDLPARNDEMAAQTKTVSALPTISRASKPTQDPQLTISQLVGKFRIKKT